MADRGLRPVAIGAEGELCLAGSGVAWGYLGFAGLTAGQFVPDPWSGARGGRIYRTGDRVRWAPGGRLHFLGRLDQQVQIRGFRVEPGEIEAILQSHPAVLQATVVIDEGSQRPLAYAALSEPEAVSERELLEFLALRLPDPLMPSHVVCLDTIPLTTRGKVDRSRLPAPERNGESASGVAPRTPKERVLAIIWSRILGAGEIGAFDDFFALGGTSLQMMQVISRVRETFDVELSPSAFYDTPTLAAIAEVIRLGQRAPLLDAGLSISAGAVPSSPCVLLREGREEGSPMVCVHSGGGHLVEYLELASEMSKLGHPVYGLQARGLTADRSSPTDRIEAMASDYVDALRAVRPAGPYRFLGYCVGAVIAFEMAQRLRAEGEDVDFLGMVEPPQAPLGATAKDGAGPIPLAVVAAFAAELKVQTSADELREIVEGEARYPEALWTIFGRQAGERARALDRDTFDRLLAVYAAVARAKSRYTASSYGGPIILFEVDMHRTTPTAVPSWCQVTAGPIGHEIIRGNHLTCLRAPYVRDFGERLHQRFLALDASAVQRGAP